MLDNKPSGVPDPTDGQDWPVCPKCRGTGVAECPDCIGIPDGGCLTCADTFEVDCPTCHGEGVVEPEGPDFEDKPDKG